MLSIFSHAGWPFRCLPWESVYLSSLPIFFLIRSFFFMLNCMHILDIHPLLDILLTNIFSHSVGSVFVLLIISFAV